MIPLVVAWTLSFTYGGTPVTHAYMAPQQCEAMRVALAGDPRAKVPAVCTQVVQSGWRLR